MAEEEMERRLKNLERAFKIIMVLVLVNLSCSLFALIIVIAVLLAG
ncbi:MAG TPA: hypothetical protein VMX96_03525 [Dehalococcoidia bacterium]|nr:hypothetical protein [Dehalococcoidia bacterium]